MTQRYLKTAEAADALGIHRTTLAKWTRKYGLRPAARTIGGQYRWDLDDLRRQIRELERRLAADPESHDA